MMGQDSFRTLRQDKRLTRTLLVLGLALWVCGLLLKLIAWVSVGLALRSAALCLLGGYALLNSSLLSWTLFSMLAGCEVGMDLPQVALQLRLPGELFLRMIRMIVAPLLFATITTGIAAHGELKGVGRIALKAIVYFEIVTTIGLLIGALWMNWMGAGWGIQLPAVQAIPTTASIQGWQQILLNLFPENIAQAVAQNQVLQVAVFSVFFGAALALLSEEKKEPLVKLLQSLADVMFRMTRFALLLAPLAAGGALAYTIASAGLGTLLPLVKLFIGFYAALAVFTLFVQLPSLLLFRVPLVRFLKAVSEPAAIGFATTTSEAALPLAMERMEEFGVPRWIVSFVIPAGYSFNMTGSSVYLAMAAIFCAQASGVHLTTVQQIQMLLTLMIASKGIAGVPRAVIVVLMATASSLQLSTAPILLIMGIDTLMDMGRTAMNVSGNCIAAAIIARSEGELGGELNLSSVENS
jgi:proton glutamate symport protein